LAQPLVDGNPSSIAGLFIVLCLYFLSKRKDTLAGIFLALATIKPQLTLLFFILVCLWAFSNRRWTVLIASGAGVAGLMGISFAILPEWFRSFLVQMTTYTQVASPNTPKTILVYWLPQAAGWIALGFTLICGGILVAEWRRVCQKGFKAFFWTACLTFTLLPVSGMTSAKSNFIAILPGFVLVVAVLEQHWRGSKIWVDVLLVVLLVASWFFPLLSLQLNHPMLAYLDLVLAPIGMTAALYAAKGADKQRLSTGQPANDPVLVE
jgi:hypothetical protein